MPYITNINAPKARGDAMKLLIKEQLPVGVVALRLGVNRSTIWRWLKKWQQQNSNIHFTNSNRINRQVKPAGYIPGVGAVSEFRLQSCTWDIPTLSSRPHSRPPSHSSAYS